MRSARLLLAVVVLGFLGGCGKGAKPRPTTQTSASSGANRQQDDEVLAYSTENGVFVRRVGEPSASSLQIPAGVQPVSLTWARDGQALAWFELDSGVPARATLAMYDTVSHETLRPELSSEPTSGPVAISSGFAIIDRHGVIRVFDTAHRMNSSRPQPTEIRVSWPVDVDTDHLPMLLASTRDQLLVAQSSSGASAYGGPQDVFLVGLDGSTTKVIEGTNGQAGPLHNLPFGPVAVTPDLSQVAITGWSRAERCVEVSDIDAVRLPSGAPVAVPPPPSPPAGSFEKVLSLHYGGGGDLIASIVDVPTNCADGSLTPHLFELSGQRWHALDQDGRWSARSGLGTLAVIRSPVAIQHGIVDAFGPGRLEVVASNGSSSTIANEVLQAAWDPVTSHVAVPAP